MSAASLDPKKLIFPDTASRRGRTISVSPANSSLAHLHYGRIRLDAEAPRVSFETGKRETALLCMRGECMVRVGSEEIALDLHDALYVPRGTSLEVITATDVDLV